MREARVVAGRYRVLDRLGRGGMGAVYEAEHVGTGGKVALKLLATPELLENREVLARFEREARAAAQLRSRHIVQVFDVGMDDESGSPFLAMERLNGEDLSTALKRLGALPCDVALRILAQACRGIAAAHQHGIVHRDIKPGNLFLASGDDELIVKVLDFGIAKVRIEQAHEASEASQLTRTGSLLGSPQYMSPEQAHGLKDIGPASDVWSLGVLLYKMLTGVTPHHHVHELGRLIVAITTRSPRSARELAPWIPEAVASRLVRALSLKPRDRYPDASALLDDLKALIPNGTVLKPNELVAIAPTEKKELEERLAVTIADAAETVPPGEIASRHGDAIRADEEAKTHTALAQSNEQAHAQRRRWPVALGLGVLALGGAAFVLKPRFLPGNQPESNPPSATLPSALAVPDASSEIETIVSASPEAGASSHIEPVVSARAPSSTTRPTKALARETPALGSNNPSPSPPASSSSDVGARRKFE